MLNKVTKFYKMKVISRETSASGLKMGMTIIADRDCFSYCTLDILVNRKTSKITRSLYTTTIKNKYEEVIAMSRVPHHSSFNISTINDKKTWTRLFGA